MILEKLKSYVLDVGFGKVECAHEHHARETLTLAVCNRADTTEILIILYTGAGPSHVQL